MALPPVFVTFPPVVAVLCVIAVPVVVAASVGITPAVEKDISLPYVITSLFIA
jgi:hypothetical protein